MSEQCSKQVFSDGWGGHQCPRKAIATEEGKPVCRQHTKAAREQREAKSKARYDAYLRRVNAPYDRIKALKDTNAKLLAALLSIAAHAALVAQHARQTATVQAMRRIEGVAREAIREAGLGVQNNLA